MNSILKRKFNIAAIAICLISGLARAQAAAPTAPQVVEKVRSNEFFRIRIERPNGFDLRENVLPKELIPELLT